MIFPEGTCSNRSGLILFKAGKYSVHLFRSLPKRPAITWVISCAVVCLDSCMIVYAWRWTSAARSDRISFTERRAGRRLYVWLRRPAQRQDAEKLHSIIFAPRVCVCLCCTIVPGLLCLIPFLPVSNSVIPSKPCWSHSVVLCLNVCVFLCVFPGWCATSSFCMCLLLLCLFTDSHSNNTMLHAYVQRTRTYVCACVCIVLMCPPVCYSTCSLLVETWRI